MTDDDSAEALPTLGHLPPQRTELDPDDPHTALVEKVQDALRTVPSFFTSTTVIDGIESRDLFSLNSVLGGAIEVQVVETLNRIRNVWDPNQVWEEARFERSSQTFPDVRLVARTGGTAKPLLGIELKGWYLLAREQVPTFRYQVTPAACHERDLLVVYPWHLRNVLSGVPVVHEPFITSALFAARYRNHWWQHVRDAKGANIGIIEPVGAHPYPDPKTNSSDAPVSDKGGNFGRIARIRLPGFDDWTSEMLQRPVVGIEALHWIKFFAAFTDAGDPDALSKKVEYIVQQAAKSRRLSKEQIAVEAESLLELLRSVADVVKSTE